MELVSPIVTAGTLAFIFAEDISRFRIRVIWFVLLLLSIIIPNIFFNTDSHWLVSSVSNILISGIMLSLTIVVLKLIHPNRFGSLNKIGGAGDLLMLIAFCIQYETIAFVYILLGTLLLALFCHIILVRITHGNGNRIPLAGYMALILLITLALAKFNIVNLSSDTFWSQSLMLYE